MITAPISGEALGAIIRDGYLQNLVPRLVATGPEVAVARLRDAFGAVPSRSGHDNPAIRAFREWLFDHTANGPAKDALLIVAPHTHWDEGLPIVYRAASAARYVVGPTVLAPQAVYRPVSFVFSAEGPLPYEWADASIAMPEAELESTWQAITAASQEFWREGWPLGLSINFRFKSRLFEDRPIDNVEREIAGDASHQSEIIRTDAGGSPSAADDALQVAWHCYSDRCYGLSATESGLVEQLRALSDGLDGEKWASAVAKATAAVPLPPNRT